MSYRGRHDVSAHVSSIVIAIPSPAHRSRICRARVNPPSFDIFKFDGVHGLIIHGSHEGGNIVDDFIQDKRPRSAARTVKHSSYVLHGCSR